MSDQTICWSLKELSGTCHQIKKQIEILEHNQRFLKGFATDVAEAWQTPVGEIYTQHLHVNTDDLKIILEQLEEFMRVLNMVRRDCYQQAEDDIAKRIQTLRQNCC